MLTIYDWFGYELPIKERYRLIKEVGLVIENIHTPFQIQDNIWLDTLDGEASIDCYIQCVKDCAEFQIPTMVVHLPDDDKLYNALGLYRIKKIAETAEQLGVNVALENLHNFTNLAYMLEQVDSKRMGFCYDCCHHYHYYPNYDLLSMYGSRMMALHLHDFDGNSIHRLPFDGTINWSKAMKNITRTGYSGPIAIEAMNWNYKHLSAKEFLKEAFVRAKRLESLQGVKNGDCI